MLINWTCLEAIPPALRQKAEDEYVDLVQRFPECAPRDGFDMPALLTEIELLHDETDPGGLRRAALSEMAKEAFAVALGYYAGPTGPLNA